VERADINVSFNRIICERPKEWLEGFIDYYTNQGYGLYNNLKGLDGVIQVLEARSNLESHPNKKLSEHAMLKFYSGVYEGVSAFCGVCKVNAAIAIQILVNKFEISHIVLTRVAGALNKRLEIGDIVISSEIVYHVVAHSILTEYHPWMDDIYFIPDVELLKSCEDIGKSLSIPNPY
jgi:nucleoside phosphorylase